MPLQEHMKLISVDDHVIEHPRVWLDRLPAKHAAAAPQVTELSDDLVDIYKFTVPKGAQVWMYEGRPYPQLGTGAVAGKDPKDWASDPVRYDDMMPAFYDPVARAAEMDADGVWTELCFPTFPRFAGTNFLEGKDHELALLCVQAYNDFIIDEWCAAVPGRQIPMVILPLWDPVLAAEEIRRTAAKGARAISFPENPAPLGLPSFYTDHWDPAMAAAEEAGMPLCLHFGTSRALPLTSPEAPHIVQSCLMGTNSMNATAELLFSPVFHKFGDLKVVLSEGGIGWIPYLLERIDLQWERHRWWQQGIVFDQRPSELFARNMYGCFIEDTVGLKARHDIGLDRILWESDFPHGDGLYPHSRKRAAELFEDIPDGEVHDMVENNARALFSFYD